MPMPYRQVHMDFHTSGLIPDIGSAFDPDEFAQTLRTARVDKVNLFAKCHHGYSYHPTDVGEMHPNLSFDLLRAQVDALHGVGIQTAIYISAAWDELAAQRHPEWVVIDPDTGEPLHAGTDERPGWWFLDLSTPYIDYLHAQVAEVIELFGDAGGLWIDICHQMLSVSEIAEASMASAGLDPTRHEDLVAHAERTSLRNLETISTMAREAGMSIFFNFGHVRRGRPEVLRDHFSHVEIESLPTAEWGYDHFPVSARYVEPLGIDALGMTGKFHHLWGEMGGYKLPEALVHECASMLAQGVRICIGDHLHPTGRIDPSTYAAVGEAYAWVEAGQPWCEDTHNVAEIGVLSSEAVRRPPYAGPSPHHDAVDEGTVRALLEHTFTFDVLGPDAGFAPYRLLVLPDDIPIDAQLEERLDAYVAGGGRLLLTGDSGVSADAFRFAAGTEHHGLSPFTGGDFVLPVPALRSDFVDEPLFLYGPSRQLSIAGGDSLGEIFDPYLDRAGRRFSGHLHAPHRPEPSGFVFGATHGAITRLAHPVFSLYHRSGAVALLQIIGKVIDHALGAPRMLRTSLPTAGRATLRRRGDTCVLHLLHASPALRGRLRGDDVQPIQDIVALHDVAVSVRTGGASAVTLVPEGTALDFTTDGRSVTFDVPVLRGHRMIVIEQA